MLVRAELDDRMRLNNWSISASYDTARIFAGLGFGSSTASRSIISLHLLTAASGTKLPIWNVR